MLRCLLLFCLFLTAPLFANEVAGNEQSITLLAQGEEFQIIHRPAMAAEHRGAVILIPSLHDPYGNRQGFARLRLALSEQGYSSYLVVNTRLEQKESEPLGTVEPAGKIPEQGILPKNQSPAHGDKPTYVPSYQQAITEKALNTHRRLLEARLEATFAHAQASGRPISLIAVGQNAGLLSEFLSDYPDMQLQAFISIGAYLSDPQRHQHIGANLSVLATAVLDVHNPGQHPWALAQRAQRQQWAQKNHKLDYRQIWFSAELIDAQQTQRLSREIDGFLRRLF
ncbi:DUF3530 family protein [Pseudoalteromonas sp. BDTF-M6]|uniref:DUF3530 family protein n=1 Tax=Pseudoalteromonas sp. BDTF-M6 TaxID=2796132 RepID=UPI001BAFED54|nr:DUF3530 family protein [Pseudoalteromonas sp. BDTF-M6]MBS3798268.1 DUF3530 family protein [Pseudoalteromonas sp. BDTF-M6]